jgi:hypothetical protein
MLFFNPGPALFSLNYLRLYASSPQFVVLHAYHGAGPTLGNASNVTPLRAL